MACKGAPNNGSPVGRHGISRVRVDAMHLWRLGMAQKGRSKRHHTQAVWRLEMEPAVATTCIEPKPNPGLQRIAAVPC